MANAEAAGRRPPVAGRHRFLVLLARFAEGAALALAQERGRWFLWVPVAFATGIAAYFALVREPPLTSLVLAFAIAIAVMRLWRGNVATEFVLLCAAAASAGAVFAKIETELSRAPVLERRLYNVPVEGIIERIEPRPARGPRVTLAVLSLANLPVQNRPVRVRIRLLKPAPGLELGTAVMLKAVLAPPARPALPGGYDFARSAYYRRLGAVGYAFAAPEVLHHVPTIPFLMRLRIGIEHARKTIGERIASHLPGQAGAIANALMTGERGRISESTREAYRDSGLLHLLSISGLHMAIMGGTVFFALRLVLAMWPAIALRYPIKKWAAAGAIVAALAYLLVSGTTHATQRAFVMISIMMLAVICDRPAIALRNVALAALALLMMRPSSLLNVGFQMSFAAVVALVASYEALRERRRLQEPDVPRGAVMTGLLFFAGTVGSTLIASLAVAPIGAFHFHKAQQYAVLANLIAVPICNFIVMPMALASFILMPLGMEFGSLAIMGQGIALMTWCAEAVSKLPGAVSHVPAFSVSAFAAIVFGGLWLCLWQRRWRLWGIALVLAGICVAPLAQRPDVLVGRNGRLVAVRTDDGQFAALDSRGARFELARWLQHDGDSRDPTDATNRRAFRCDRLGCNIRKSGTLIAVSREPAALIDDCVRADLLLLTFPQPPGCRPKGPVLDFWRLRADGTHAVYLSEDGAPRIVSVRQQRGHRPWSRAQRRSARRRTRTSRSAPRLAAFAAPKVLSVPPPRRVRPDIEDEPFAGWGH